MNIANQLTILRILLIPIFLIFLLLDITTYDQFIAISIFVVAALTDALDGHLARSKNLITNFGKFLDPVADKLLVCSALIAFIEIGILQAWVVIVVISRDFILTSFRMIASSEGVVIAADKLGKIKTMLQMIMIVYLMFMFTNPLMVLIGNILVWAVVVLTVLSALDYIIKNKNVLRLDDI